MLWFNFILGRTLFFRFKLDTIYYHTQQQREIKFKSKVKLNHSIYFCESEGEVRGVSQHKLNRK